MKTTPALPPPGSRASRPSGSGSDSAGRCEPVPPTARWLLITPRREIVPPLTEALGLAPDRPCVVWCRNFARVRQAMTGATFQGVVLDLSDDSPQSILVFIALRQAAATSTLPIVVVADENTQDLAFAALHLGAASFIYGKQLTNRSVVSAALQLARGTRPSAPASTALACEAG